MGGNTKQADNLCHCMQTYWHISRNHSFYNVLQCSHGELSLCPFLPLSITFLLEALLYIHTLRRYYAINLYGSLHLRSPTMHYLSMKTFYELGPNYLTTSKQLYTYIQTVACILCDEGIEK